MVQPGDRFYVIVLPAFRALPRRLLVLQVPDPPQRLIRSAVGFREFPALLRVLPERGENLRRLLRVHRHPGLQGIDSPVPLFTQDFGLDDAGRHGRQPVSGELKIPDLGFGYQIGPDLFQKESLCLLKGDRAA